MQWEQVIGCGFAGFGAVLILMRLLLRLRPLGSAGRSLELHHTHRRYVPRYGGVALAVSFGLLEGLIMALTPDRGGGRTGARAVVLASSLGMFGLGFWDDLKALEAKRKLGVQIVIALAVYVAGFGIESLKLPFTERVVALHGWGALFTVLWLVGFTNLLNLIDGVDGLAAGIALMLMALLVYVGAQNGAFVLEAAGMVGGLLAFLWFNFPPARIYLGDGGAYFLGFQLGLFALLGSQKGTIVAALVAPLFVLALPIMDAALAIARRGLRGLPVFRPDRRHIHHHLLGMGLSRRQVVLWLYSLTLVFLAMGFAAFWSRGHLVPVLLGFSALLLLWCAGRLSFSRRWFAIGSTLGESWAMRQEIHYALSLMGWLAQEGRRCDSLEGLFGDLAFAARRLGFVSVRLKLADGERIWQEPLGGAPLQRMRQELRGGDFGVLELAAVARPRGMPADSEVPASSPLTDPCLFEIMAELLAEAWNRAVTNSGFGPRPLRFDLPVPAARGRLRRFSALRLRSTLARNDGASALSLSDGSAGLKEILDYEKL
jgi:UDP-GlcNAc:undecaprenyl-phosphate/decaprenyl-phosphate GlcNAc-1-phosphate transferase